MLDFYAKRHDGGRTVYATFWISGIVGPSQMNGYYDAMDVDGVQVTDAVETQVLIVGEDVLESAY